MQVILGDPKRLKLLAKDFVEHYETRVNEGASVKGKVMFVSSSRPIAYNLYKEIITLRPAWAEVRESDGTSQLTEAEKRELKPIEKIKMVMTREKDDNETLYNLLGTKDYRKELDRQFKQVNSNFKIAIVVDMWITGFDVPFLDAIYIDKPIQQHSLIQTISRVNRVYEGKEMGLVVDYIGIKSNMNIALKKYSKYGGEEFDEIEKTVTIVKDKLDLLNRLFHKFDASKYYNGSPLEKLHCLNRAAEFVQSTDEIEKRFMTITKKMRGAYDLSVTSELLSHQERDQIHFYFAVRSIVYKLTKGDTAPDLAQMNARVTEMIHEALQSEGIEEIFKLDKNDPDNNVNIFSDEYLAKIDKIKLPNTKIKLLQMLLKKAIEEFKKVNKIKGVDFSKRLKHLVDLYNERKDFETFKSEVMDDVAEQFANLFKELQDERNSFLELGINFEEKAFYDILKAISEKYKFPYPEDKLIVLSRAVKAIVDDKARYTDWSQRNDIKAELKVALILTLDDHGYPPFTQDEVYKEIFDQAENFKKYIDNEIVSIGNQEFTLRSENAVSFYEFTLDLDFDKLTDELLSSFREALAQELELSLEDVHLIGCRPGSTELLVAIKRFAITISENIKPRLSRFNLRDFLGWRDVPDQLTFISYARIDELLIEGVYYCLKSEILHPWMDVHDILPGQDWDYQILKAIHLSTGFVFCLSRNSIGRLEIKATLFKELETAKGKSLQFGPDGIFLIPLRFDDSKIPDIIGKYEALIWNQDKEKLVNGLREGLKQRKQIIH